MYVPVTGSSDGGATSVCGGNLSDSTAEGGPPTLDAYDTDAASLVSSAHHIYQREYLFQYNELVMSTQLLHLLLRVPTFPKSGQSIKPALLHLRNNDQLLKPNQNNVFY